MKKGISGLIVLVIIVVALLLVVSWGVGIYNKIVPLNEKVATEWSNVETQYQRRADLIPNFVNTVKGAAEFEQETLTRVIEARAKATSVTVDPSNITPEQLQQFQTAQSEVSSALAAPHGSCGEVSRTEGHTEFPRPAGGARRH